METLKIKNFFSSRMKKHSISTIFDSCPKLLIIQTLQKLHNKKLRKMAKDIQEFSYKFPRTPILTILDHEGIISCVCFSPCGNYLASVGEDQTIYIHSVNPHLENFGKQLMFYKRQQGKINSVHYSSCGKYIVTGSEDKTGLVTNVDPNNQNKYGKKLVWLTENEGVVNDAKFSPCGRVNVMVGDDKLCTVYSSILTSERFGKSINKLEDTSEVISCCFNPAGNTLATSNLNRFVTLYNMQGSNDTFEFTKLAIITENYYAIRHVSFSNCGKLLAIGGFDLTVIVQNIDLYCDKFMKEEDIKTKEIELLKRTNIKKDRFENDQWVLCQSFSPNGDYLVACSSSSEVQFYGVDCLKQDDYGKLVHDENLDLGFYTRTVSYSPNGKYIAVGTDSKEVLLFA